MHEREHLRALGGERIAAKNVNKIEGGVLQETREVFLKVRGWIHPREISTQPLNHQAALNR